MIVGSREVFFDNASRLDTGQLKIEHLETMNQSLMVESEQMQNGRVQVANVNGVLSRVVLKVIRRSVCESRSHAATSEPNREAARVLPECDSSQLLA